MAWPSLVLAQQADTQADSSSSKPVVSKAKPTGPNATVTLINLMIRQGLITEEQAQAAIKQAEDEAYIERQAAKDATIKANEATKAAAAAAGAASPPGSKHVTYVPEIVKKQLRDEIKKEVMAEAKQDNWASPGLYPEWASRIHLYGDLRNRFEGDLYPKGAANAAGYTTNFNSINTGSAYDVSQSNYIAPPAYNNSTNNERDVLRVRLGLEADLYDGFTAGLRIATGDSNTPVSTNATLGTNFSKYQLWLDRGYVQYKPIQDLSVSFGRFDNPFFSATDLVWFSEIGFDGVAFQAKQEVWPGFTPFAVAGAFPIFNTNLNAATTQDTTAANDNRYLFGGQLGARWKAVENLELTGAVAYFDFTNVQAQLSTPCDVTLTSTCSTDALRPAFAQKGNTYTYLRDISPPAGYSSGYYTEPEYFGLASQFRPLDVSFRADLTQFDPIHVILDGEYVVNTGFNRAQVTSTAVNNLAGTSDGSPGPFNGGNMGWMGRLTVGETKFTKFGDWNANVAYKYLQSDAVMDAFADSDFGLGGTNLKGYIVGGSFAWSANIWTTVRWLSATNIAGTPYAVDVLQVDLNAKF